MGKSSINLLRRALHNPFIAGLLAIAFVFMLILFFVQWLLIRELLEYSMDLVENELIRQVPDGVGAPEITKTFAHVRQALMGMPMSYITGKISLKKAKKAIDYAIKANTDGEWASEEVDTMLKMMNAAVGFKREEK